MVTRYLHFLSRHVESEELEISCACYLREGVGGPELCEDVAGRHVDYLRCHVDEKLLLVSYTSNPLKNRDMGRGGN